MIITSENYSTYTIGPKAGNLFRLMEHGFPVPPFFCISEDFCEEEVLCHLHRHFPHTRFFSVRSCASAEDGDSCSFAGQFQTFLRVERNLVCARIQSVLSCSDNKKALEYCRIHHINPSSIRMYVIVQEMIEADCSGVLFTANPLGILNETVIVQGAGTGDQTVEDRTDTTTWYYNLTDRICYREQTGDAPLMTNSQIRKLIHISRKIRKLFRQECDLEYAWKDGTLYLLQVRPITTLKKDAPVIILDNSNIVESYPGITLPLTQSFIRDSYYQVFRSLLLHLTGERKTVRHMDHILQNMVDMANGRVYYRISNWYDILLLLPFHRKLIPLWQEMMGVGNKTVSSCLEGRVRKITRLKTACSFFRLLCTCPRKMEELDSYFSKIQKHFRSLDMTSMDNRALLKAYHTLKDMTIQRWDMTLVNDMYAFLFTGLLKFCLKIRRVPDYDLAASRSIRGNCQLDSLEPILELNRIAKKALREHRLAELQMIQCNEDYERYIQETDDPFTRQLKDYICRFGDRNVEELKLESQTFRTDPILLIRYLTQYADALLLAEESTALPKHLSPPRPGSVDSEASVRLRGLAGFFAAKAALGIRNRERSRLHRSRLYGMMRTLVLQTGANLQAQGRIESVRDIFWLTCQEIEQEISAPMPHLQELIASRKEQYEGFHSLPAYSRLVFSGKVTDKTPKKARKITGSFSSRSYTGTACSPGIAEGRVLVLRHPTLQTDTTDRILVTQMTDPGWVFLIAHAKAIIAEKGSLLSHTAIICRELLKPAVVGIPHITEQLKDGDYVRVDADTGIITVLSHTESGETGESQHENPDS